MCLIGPLFGAYETFSLCRACEYIVPFPFRIYWLLVFLLLFFFFFDENVVLRCRKLIQINLILNFLYYFLRDANKIYYTILLTLELDLELAFYELYQIISK